MPYRDSRGATLHYVSSSLSDRPWLVLSNSLGTNLSMWDGQMAAFEPHFNVLRYDSRGHGESTFSAAFTLADLAQDVLTLLDALGIANASFCGLSLGGMIGQWLAIHAPQRLSAAVLCCTAAKIGNTATWNERIAAVTTNGLASIIPSILDRWYTPAFRAQSPADVERTRAMLEATDQSAYTATCAAIRDTDFTTAVSSIRIPTLVVCGAQDPVTPPSDAAFLAHEIHGARLLQLDAAHLANIEDFGPLQRWHHRLPSHRNKPGAHPCRTLNATNKA